MEQPHTQHEALVVYRLPVTMVAALRPAVVPRLPIATVAKPGCAEIPWAMLYLWTDGA